MTTLMRSHHNLRSDMAQVSSSSTILIDAEPAKVLDAIADECGIGPEDRSTLYSSTEYKKIRLRYFTDDYRQWEEAHGA